MSRHAKPSGLPRHTQPLAGALMAATAVVILGAVAHDLDPSRFVVRPGPQPTASESPSWPDQVVTAPETSSGYGAALAGPNSAPSASPAPVEDVSPEVFRVELPVPLPSTLPSVPALPTVPTLPGQHKPCPTNPAPNLPVKAVCG